MYYTYTHRTIVEKFSFIQLPPATSSHKLRLRVKNQAKCRWERWRGIHNWSRVRINLSSGVSIRSHVSGVTLRAFSSTSKSCLTECCTILETSTLICGDILLVPYSLPWTQLRHSATLYSTLQGALILVRWHKQSYEARILPSVRLAIKGHWLIWRTMGTTTGAPW